jgi:signal transduction histidine kinase
MPQRSWLPDPLPGAAPDDPFVSPPLQGRGGGSRLRFLVGTAPVLSAEGERLAQIVVRMPADRPAGGASARPEILRPYEVGGAVPARELFLSEYEGDALVQTTNPEYPRLHRAPEEVVRAIFEERRDQVWKRELVADTWWINLYRPRFDGDELSGMASVGFESREARSLLVSVLMLLLVNSVGAIGCAAVLVVVSYRRLALRFQHKLLLSYILVSAIPVALLAQVNQSIAEETVAGQMKDSLRRTARQVEGEIRDELLEAFFAGNPLELARVVSNETLKEIGYRVGQEVNLFLVDAERRGGAPLLASSEPGIFATELFSDRLSGEAYTETVIRGKEFHADRETAGDFSYLVGYTPFRDPEGRILGVIGLPLIYGQDAVDRELSRRNSLLLALYVLILMIVALIGMLLARRISAPIKRLAEATHRVSAGDLDHRIPGRSRDEFGNLIDSFNKMTEDLRDSRERIVRAEKDAAWREMARQIAHEIKNPLTPMRLSAQQILRAYGDDHEDFANILNQGLDTIIRQSETLSRIASEFSAFARLPKRKLVPVDVVAIVREVCDLYRASRGVELVEEIREVPRVLADPDELKRVIVNLASNAVQAMESEGGTLRIGTGLMSAMLEDGCRHMVEIWVSDTGVGIPEEDLGRLFQPNFSTKTGGTGLGLAISRAVVDSLGGHIGVRSKVGEGSTFTVLIPPEDEAPPPEEEK